MSIAAAATTPTTIASTTSTTRRPMPGGAYPRHRLYQDKRLCCGRAVDLVGTGRPDLDADFGDAQRRRPPIRRRGLLLALARYFPRKYASD
jgi:hypothetical protein